MKIRIHRSWNGLKMESRIWISIRIDIKTMPIQTTGFTSSLIQSSRCSYTNSVRCWNVTNLNVTSWSRHGLLFFLEAEDDLLLLQDFELAEVELLLDILLTGECLVYQIQLPSLGKATKFSHRYGIFLLRVLSTKFKFCYVPYRYRTSRVPDWVYYERFLIIFENLCEWSTKCWSVIKLIPPESRSKGIRCGKWVCGTRILATAFSFRTAHFRFGLNTLQAKHLLSVGLTKALKMRKICLTVAEQAGLCLQKGIEADFEDENKEEKSFPGNFLKSEALLDSPRHTRQPSVHRKCTLYKKFE